MFQIRKRNHFSTRRTNFKNDMSSRKNRNNKRTMKICLKYLQIYFWIHLRRFHSIFDRKKEYKIARIFSFIMLLIVEANVIYQTRHYIYLIIYNTDSGNLKFGIILIFTIILELILRIIFYLKKNKLHTINMKLVSMYNKTNDNIFTYKIKLITVLLVNDLFMIIFAIIRWNIPKLFNAPEQHAYIYLSNFLFIWS